MLRWRLLLGIVFVAALLALGWLDLHATRPGAYLFPLALALAVLAAGEVLSLLAARGLDPLPWVVYGGSVAVVAANGVPIWRPEVASSWTAPASLFGLVLLVAFLGEMQRYEGPGGVMVRLALGVFGVAYVGVLLSFVVQLRLLGPTRGMLALASLVIIVKLADIGAYTVGRLIGRHKMAPVLSPGKTLEGAAGAVALSCLGAWLSIPLLGAALGEFSDGPPPAWTWLSYGVLVGVAGLLGDLAESLFKRDMGRKDSSDWMPGFGGVLDLLDSVLLAAPVAYSCWALGWFGL